MRYFTSAIVHRSNISVGGVVIVLLLLAGIGFTMSIFIAMLAFSDDNLLGAAKLGVLLGSFVAAVLGLGWGVVLARRLRSTPGNTSEGT